MTNREADVVTMLDQFEDAPASAEGRSIAREIVRRWFTTMRNKDLSGLAALMTDDIVIDLPFNESGRTEEGAFRSFRGIAECSGFWEAAFRAEGKSHGMTEVDVTISADGGVLFVEGRGNLTMASGKSYRNRYVFRFVVRGGKVARLREYYNPITSAQAFGRPVAGKYMIEDC